VPTPDPKPSPSCNAALFSPPPQPRLLDSLRRAPSATTPQRSFDVLGTPGTATLAPIGPGKRTFNLTDAAGPYKKGPQEISFPAYKRYVDDFTELAAAVRGEQLLTVSLDGELLVVETGLRACGMS
jgi:hypothetical protein